MAASEQIQMLIIATVTRFIQKDKGHTFFRNLNYILGTVLLFYNVSLCCHVQLILVFLGNYAVQENFAHNIFSFSSTLH